MKRKIGSVIMTFLLAAAIFGFVVFLSATGHITRRSAFRIGYVGNETRTTWSGQYVQLDGTMDKVLIPSGDTVTIEVETESGSLRIQIADDHGTVIYERETEETFEDTLKASGRLHIDISAEKHSGSFLIKG